MRISDWSSDVCSSDLAEDATWIVTGQYTWSHEFRGRDAIQNGLMGHFRSFFTVRPRTVAFNFIAEGDYVVVGARGDNVTSSEERRVGKSVSVRVDLGGRRILKKKKII